MGRHKIGFRLRNDLSELETLRTKLDLFQAEVGIPDKTLFELNLILDELFTNIVSCGYRDMALHWVEITISREGKLLTLCIMDDGVPFNPSIARALDTSCPLNERRIGGFGIHLVKRLTDEMAYRRANDRNIVTLSKKLP